MKKELLSLTDENSILITVEFLESARRLAYGGVETCRFELDLIVNKYITCQQLLEAIEKGLENELCELGQSPWGDDYTERLKTIYVDYALSSDHPMVTEEVQLPGLIDDKKRRQLEANSDELDDTDPLEEGTDKCRLDDPLTGYMICWKVFQDCIKAYEDNYYGLADNAAALEECDRELVRTDYIRSHPVIGRGSINFNKLERDEVLSISSRPQCWLFHERDSHRTLKELGFITTTRLVFDPILWHHSAPLFDERENNPEITAAFHGETPEYNISDRPLKKLDDEAVNIIEPTPPPQRPHQNMVSLVLPTLLSTGTMVGIRLLTSSSANMGSLALMSGAMGVTSVLVAIINRIIQNAEHTKNTNEWRKQYQDYVNRLLETIVNRQKKDVELLHKFYPPATLTQEVARKGETTLVGKILSVNGDIYSRSPNHPDFMSVRLGVSTQDSHLVPSVFDISGDKKEAVFASVRYRNILHNGTPFRILQNGETGLLMPSDGSEGYLIDLPADIAAHYGYLHGAPVLVNLEQCGTLGVIYGKYKQNCQPFLENILLDLCFHHSPEDLQCVMFCEKTDEWRKQQETIRRFKHLPHFHELLGDLSAFVFTDQDAPRVFNKLTEILSERKGFSEDTRFPHIVVIFQAEYSLKRHLFSQYLPDYTKDGSLKTNGISFVFCTEYPEQLPKYCGQVIDMRQENEHLLLPHTLLVDSIEKDRNRRQIPPTLDERVNIPLHREYYSYKPDPIISQAQHLGDKEMDDEYHRAFKVLSALHYERIAQGADMPSSVTFFDMIREAVGCEDEVNTDDTSEQNEHDNESKKNFLKPVLTAASNENRELPKAEKNENDHNDAALQKIRAELKDYVLSEWGLGELFDSGTVGRPSRDVIKSLAVPIGKNTQGIVELDLHEKGDGPHMLVAGTTGSGKTETILSYLINLCTLYTPEQVNLLLMDMKGEDFVKRIGRLPHVVGTVTDVDGDKTGTNTAYMLKRFLLSMNSEVKRRKLMLSKMGVNNISNYIEARANLDKHMHNQHIPGSRRQELEQMEPMPHLFLVIDEFTELMQFSSENGGVDFKTAITSLARVGRSLGFHIILISQNIENAITSDIRVNSRARLCLKVATREASKEMIGSDLAASPLMPGNGRAYLLVGTGSRFEYFQSAFSGADALGARDEPVLVTLATTTGEYRAFYNSEKHGTVDRKSEEEANVHSYEETYQADVEQKDVSPTLAPTAIKKTGQSGVTQIKLLTEVISEDVWTAKECAHICTPSKVFQPPMPSHCWFDFDWDQGKGHFEIINQGDVLKEEAADENVRAGTGAL